MNDQQQTPGELITVRGSLNILYLAMSGHATCFTPFLHSGFGSEAIGVNGLAALVIILLYGSFTGSSAMLTFLCVWLVVVVMQRIRTAQLRRQGCINHSRYDGYPWLATKLVKNESAARGLECLMCLPAGLLLAPYDETLATFVAAGFVSMLFKLAIEQRIENVSVQRMRDAEIEQRNLIHRNKSVPRNY